MMKQLRFYLSHPLYPYFRLKYEYYMKTHPEEPWLSPKAIEFLKKYLTKEMTMLEWGSGRSTTWFAQQTKHITSIEHNDQWVKIVEDQIKSRGLDNVDLLHIPLDHDENAPTPKEYKKTPAYVGKIFDFSEDTFDLILIDGHYRLTCADLCQKYIKPGGLLAIDNSNWMARKEWDIPHSWLLEHESFNGVTQTSIWRKPKLSSH